MRFEPPYWMTATGTGAEPPRRPADICCAAHALHNTTEGNENEPPIASRNDVVTELHHPSTQGGSGGVEGNPLALVAATPAVTQDAPLRAGGNDVAPGLHNTAEGNSLCFRWNGSYAYRTLYFLTGQQSTNTATLMHVGARHYSPSLRRWLQRDLVGLTSGEPNLYQYGGGNPVYAVDPDGTQDSVRPLISAALATALAKNTPQAWKDYYQFLKEVIGKVTVDQWNSLVNRFLEKFPASSGECYKTAEFFEHMLEARPGMVGDPQWWVVVAQNGAKYIRINGVQISTRSYHYIVRGWHQGTEWVWDAITGPEEMPFDRYRQLWIDSGYRGLWGKPCDWMLSEPELTQLLYNAVHGDGR